MRYRASITAAVIFGGLAIAVGSATAQKRYDPGASEGNITVGLQFWPPGDRLLANRASLPAFPGRVDLSLMRVLPVPVFSTWARARCLRRTS